MRMIALPLVLAAALMGASQAQAQYSNNQYGSQQYGGQYGGQSGGPPPVSPEQRFQEWDTNRDNRVTRQEFMTAAEQRWLRMLDHMDSNRDGTISKEEFLSAPPPQPPGQAPSRQ